ncbi:MAG: hypothetical protein KC478_02875 [Bacteriovoracaceae bacterium]|nr:hypothetical protein [Bacteriovoracaceae bacterium]
MKSLSTAFLPKFLKEVLTHIPTLAMKSMDWKGALKEIGPLAARMGKKHLDEDSFKTLEELNIQDISLTRESVNNNYDLLSDAQKERVGEIVLQLYFSQLNNPEGLNLDLRAKHFEWINGPLLYSPSNVWFKLREDFRQGLLDLYRGFYHNDDELFDIGLKRIGLSKNLTQQEDAQLKELFKKHFGPGDQDKVVFELEHFKESFYELFKFFMDHEVSLEKDFMFLGIYLVGLYMNLEKLSVAINVRKSFLQVFPK